MASWWETDAPAASKPKAAFGKSYAARPTTASAGSFALTTSRADADGSGDDAAGRALTLGRARTCESPDVLRPIPLATINMAVATSPPDTSGVADDAATNGKRTIGMAATRRPAARRGGKLPKSRSKAAALPAEDVSTAPPTPTSERTSTRSESTSTASWWTLYSHTSAASSGRTTHTEMDATKRRPMLKSRIARKMAKREHHEPAAFASAPVAARAEVPPPIGVVTATDAVTRVTPPEPSLAAPPVEACKPCREAESSPASGRDDASDCEEDGDDLPDLDVGAVKVQMERNFRRVSVAGARHSVVHQRQSSIGGLHSGLSMRNMRCSTLGDPTVRGRPSAALATVAEVPARARVAAASVDAELTPLLAGLRLSTDAASHAPATDVAASRTPTSIEIAAGDASGDGAVVSPRRTAVDAESDDVSSGTEPSAIISEKGAWQQCLPLILGFLDTPALRTSIPRVAPSWRHAAATALSWRVASSLAVTPRAAPESDPVATREMTLQPSNFLPFAQTFPWACFLAEGGYKQVYRVWNDAYQRFEAISVMDVAALEDADSLPIVQAEIQVGCLLAELIHTQVSPNYVDIYQVFLGSLTPSLHFPSHWGTSTAPIPQGQECPYTTAEPRVAALLSAVPAPPGAARAPRPRDAPTRGRRRGCNTGASHALSITEVCAAPWAERCRSHFEELRAVNRKMSMLSGVYQYMRMELCSAGDLEEFLRKIEPVFAHAEQEMVAEAGACKDTATASKSGTRARSAWGKTPSLLTLAAKPKQAAVATPAAIEARLALESLDKAAAELAKNYAFQMMLSLYAARERLQLRHYDVKLLNFLLATPQVPTGGKTATCLQYGLGTHTFALRLHHATTSDIQAKTLAQHIVKLADFGTADTSADTLGVPIRAFHFTTLENAPPEYFLDGDACTQGYAADTWALGLSVLHLLTGQAPYEELMEHIRCPDNLRTFVVGTWRAHSKGRRATGAVSGAKGISYKVVQSVISDCGADVLVDTLYRYLVMLDFGDADRMHAFADFAGSPVYDGLCHVLGARTDDEPSAAVGGRRRAASARLNAVATTTRVQGPDPLSQSDIDAIRRAFADHKQAFSLRAGVHQIIRRMHRRLRSWAGGLDVLMQLLQPHASSRPSMLRLLLSPAFADLQSDVDAMENDIMSFMAYSTSTDAALKDV